MATGDAAMTQTIARETVARTVETGHSPITIRLEPVIKMTEEEFVIFCKLNEEVQIERTTEGAIELMPRTPRLCPRS